MPLLAFFFSLMLGRFEIAPLMTLKILFSKILGLQADWPPVMEKVVIHVRLVRILAAMLVGAGLSVSGASFQGLFRNPLVSPYILGVSAGAGFGAALGILFSKSILIIQLWAFLCGLGSVALSYGISRLYKQPSEIVLVLAGTIVGAFFTALISFIKYIADPYEKLPAIVFWLMGSFASTSYALLLPALLPMLIPMAILLVIRWRINVLSLGDEEARSLGLDTGRLKVVVVLCATLITSSAVAICGIIGWVGLIIPHIARMLVGPDHGKMIPVSLWIGAVYLVLIDDVARSISAAEIPIGILTALIGAPFFAYLLTRRKTGW
ncbi:MAG: iron ABC transporter permease [Desulfobacteraceae bacterium]|nr:MAG: iron ABC transporter permease [Desulfobacteraceae bacterium]